MMSRLLIFDTHPIQYRSPVFRVLQERGASFHVYYFDSGFEGKKIWFHEFGKAKSSDFGLSLTQGFPSTILGLNRASWFRKWRTLKKILQAEKPESILIYGYYLPEHWMLNWLCRRYGVKLLFVGETFSQSSSAWRRWIKAIPLGWFYRGVHGFVSIGVRTKEYYEAQGVASGRIHSARYCVDNRFFAIDRVEQAHLRETWRQRLGIPQDGVVVLFVGRLFSRKRPWDVLEIQKMLPMDLGISTVVIGSGPMESALRAASLGMPRMYYLGFQDQVQTRAAYCGSDILLLPSEYETWGLVVNESIAGGLVPVITDTCGVAGDLVVDGETGFTFAVGDVQTACKKIQLLAKERSTRFRMADKGFKRLKDEFSPEAFAEVLIRASTPASSVIASGAKQSH
jgi:glycosyltransferase involved in cell wall biosynthesis